MMGDTVVLKPGERVSVDGTIVSGRTSVNEAMLTGESMPVDKEVGDKVYAGTINGEGAVLFTATGVGADTALGRIVHMVEEAQGSKAPIARMGGRRCGVLCSGGRRRGNIGVHTVARVRP